MSTVSRLPFVSSIYDRMLVEDDTEESVSGSDFHLMAIFALYDVLRRYARDTARRWYVTAEVLILADLADRRRNPWRSMPDVYVIPDVDDAPRISLDIRAGLPFPRFVCEVASESTWERDVDEKQKLFADLGAQEYIVFDPTGDLLGEPLRAWRRYEDGRWDVWAPDEDGFLVSTVLGLWLRADDTLLRVYDPVRGRLPTANELAAQIREQAEARSQMEQALQEQAEARAQMEQALQEQAEARAQAEQALQEQAETTRELAHRLEQERVERQALEEEIARLRGALG